MRPCPDIATARLRQTPAPLTDAAPARGPSPPTGHTPRRHQEPYPAERAFRSGRTGGETAEETAGRPGFRGLASTRRLRGGSRSC